MMTNTNVANAAKKVVDQAADAIKTAAASEPKDAAPTKGRKSSEPKRYRSTTDAYVDKVFYKAGEPFVTDAPKGDDWAEISVKEFAADEAATNRVPDDANLDEASKSALQAVAIIKHVNITGLDKAGLITAIKAAYEPKL